MKKIVNFLGAALIATSMIFVACSKDEDNADKQSTSKVPSVTYTWDGTTYSQSDIKNIDVSMLTSGDTTWYGLAASPDAKVAPYVELVMSRTHTDTSEFELEYLGVMTSYEHYSAMDSLEWIANIDSCSFNITEFDATLNRMNISIGATLYDYAELTAEPQKTGAYTTKTLSLEAKNISFNPANIIDDPAGTDDPAARTRRLREILEAAAKLE